jgi:hypothetical protein
MVLRPAALLMMRNAELLRLTNDCAQDSLLRAALRLARSATARNPNASAARTLLALGTGPDG